MAYNIVIIKRPYFLYLNTKVIEVKDLNHVKNSGRQETFYINENDIINKKESLKETLKLTEQDYLELITEFDALKQPQQ